MQQEKLSENVRASLVYIESNEEVKEERGETRCDMG
jgi:hypothetical protein